MTDKKMERRIKAIAKQSFGFDLEPIGCDGYDFFDSDRGSISVGALQDALEKAYLAGAQAERDRLSPIDREAKI